VKTIMFLCLSKKEWQLFVRYVVGNGFKVTIDVLFWKTNPNLLSAYCLEPTLFQLSNFGLLSPREIPTVCFL
jgi:hypothetical protein